MLLQYEYQFQKSSCDSSQPTSNDICVVTTTVHDFRLVGVQVSLSGCRRSFVEKEERQESCPLTPALLAFQCICPRIQI